MISLARLQRLAVLILLPALETIFANLWKESRSINVGGGDLASVLISWSWSGRNGVGRRVKKYYHIVGGFP